MIGGELKKQLLEEIETQRTIITGQRATISVGLPLVEYHNSGEGHELDDTFFRFLVEQMYQQYGFILLKKIAIYPEKNEAILTIIKWPESSVYVS